MERSQLYRAPVVAPWRCLDRLGSELASNTLRPAAPPYNVRPDCRSNSLMTLFLAAKRRKSLKRRGNGKESELSFVSFEPFLWLILRREPCLRVLAQDYPERTRGELVEPARQRGVEWVTDSKGESLGLPRAPLSRGFR